MTEAVETPYADRKLGKKEARPDSIKLKLEDFVDKRDFGLSVRLILSGPRR
jgi:hypothetical protein